MLLTLLFASAASADEERNVAAASPQGGKRASDSNASEPAFSFGFGPSHGNISLRAEVGFASAIGLLGGTATLSLVPWLQTEIGVGYGISGTQYSLMQKIAFGTPRMRILGGIGVAYTVPHSGGPAVTGNPIWLNVDIAGIEYRFRYHFLVFGAWGFAHGLGNGTIDTTITETADGKPNISPVEKLWFPQARMGIGVWF